MQDTVVEGQERGIADALFVAQQQLKDEAGESLIDDASIEMALTDIVNGGETLAPFTVAIAPRANRSPPASRCGVIALLNVSSFQFTNY